MLYKYMNVIQSFGAQGIIVYYLHHLNGIILTLTVNKYLRKKYIYNIFHKYTLNIIKHKNNIK